MTVVYHTLLSQPEETVERLFAACGIEDDGGQLRPEALKAMETHSQNNIFSKDAR